MHYTAHANGIDSQPDSPHPNKNFEGGRMRKIHWFWLLVNLLVMAGGAHAQNPAVDRLTQFATTEPQRQNATAIGVLCFPGNRLTARLQADCNNLVGNAFTADPASDTAVRAALAIITADNATVPIDRSGLGKLSLLPSAPTQGGPGLAALMQADQSMMSLSLSDDGSGGSNWSMFVNARFNNDEHDATSNADGFDRDGRAVTVGVDLRTSAATHLGAAISYAKSDMNYTGNSGSLDSTDVGFNLFAGWQGSSGFYLDSLLAINRRSSDQIRRIAYGLGANTVNQRFDSSFDTDDNLLALTAGYQFASGAASFDPYVRVEFVDAKSDGYSEASRSPGDNGGGWGVQVASIDEKFTRAIFGFRAAYAISGSNGVYVPFVDLSWINVSGADNNPAGMRYLGDLSTAVNATPVDFFLPADKGDNSYASAALGLSAQWANGWSGFLSYRQYLAFDRYDQREINTGLRMEF
jgi:outer membrane autotransporter protein